MTVLEAMFYMKIPQWAIHSQDRLPYVKNIISSLKEGRVDYAIKTYEHAQDEKLLYLNHTELLKRSVQKKRKP